MKAFTSGLFFMLLVATAGCAAMDRTRHEYMMKGQILEVADAGVYLCIGSKDGAKVDDEFKVYKISRLSFNPKTSSSPSFKREETGTVKIIEIVDEHFAKATILTGRAEINSIVELNN